MYYQDVLLMELATLEAPAERLEEGADGDFEDVVVAFAPLLHEHLRQSELPVDLRERPARSRELRSPDWDQAGGHEQGLAVEPARLIELQLPEAVFGLAEVEPDTIAHFGRDDNLKLFFDNTLEMLHYLVS